MYSKKNFLFSLLTFFLFNPGTCNQGEQLIPDDDDDLVANENMDEVPLVVDEGPELVPEIGEEVEINAANQHEENVPAPAAPLSPPVNPSVSSVQPRRTGRPKQYSARYQSYRKSLDRPLAKMGLLGMLLILAVLLLHS